MRCGLPGARGGWNAHHRRSGYGLLRVRHGRALPALPAPHGPPGAPGDWCARHHRNGHGLPRRSGWGALAIPRGCGSAHPPDDADRPAGRTGHGLRPVAGRYACRHARNARGRCARHGHQTPAGHAARLQRSGCHHEPAAGARPRRNHAAAARHHRHGRSCAPAGLAPARHFFPATGACRQVHPHPAAGRNAAVLHSFAHARPDHRSRSGHGLRMARNRGADHRSGNPRSAHGHGPHPCAHRHHGAHPRPRYDAERGSRPPHHAGDHAGVHHRLRHDHHRAAHAGRHRHQRNRVPCPASPRPACPHRAPRPCARCAQALHAHGPACRQRSWPAKAGRCYRIPPGRWRACGP